MTEKERGARMTKIVAQAYVTSWIIPRKINHKYIVAEGRDHGE